MAIKTENNEKIYVYPIEDSKEWREYAEKNGFAIATNRLDEDDENHYLVYTLKD